MDLLLARQTLGRAQRMLDDLSRHADDEVAFRDRLPYVLDLLAGITRCINDESKGHRTSQFAAWWQTADRTTQAAIQELRNAELKRAESRTKPQVKVEVTPRGPRPPVSMTVEDPVSMTVQDLVSNQFSLDVSTDWRFTDGDLDGKPVVPALAEYWNQVSGVLAEAETLLGG